MSIESLLTIEKNDKKDDKSLVEHLVELRNIVGRVMSGAAGGGEAVPRRL
jgi:flagellar basal body-associated protein FliL